MIEVSETIEIDLRRCPFCGSRARLGGSDNVNGSPYWYVFCSNMECGGNQFGSENKAEVVAKWNRRSYESIEPTAHA